MARTRLGKRPVRASSHTARKRGHNGDGNESWLRFGVATLLRLSDRLTGRLVSGYDQAFDLDDRERARIYADIGVSFLRERNFENAIAAFRRALAFRADDGVLWSKLGLAHVGRGAPAAAVKAFRKAVELGSDDFELHFHRAEALGELGDREGEVSALGAALAHRSDDAETHYRLGVALDLLERYDEAIRAFGRAIELEPREAGYHQSLGFCYDSIGEHREAIRSLKRAAVLEQRRRHQTEPVPVRSPR
jgi:tetratricopeptide (TPR) repeat protein